MDILELFRKLKQRLNANVLNPRKLQLNSSGTKTKDLPPNDSYQLDTNTGYWTNPSSVSSKPPRWIVQYIDGQARFSLDPNGNDYTSNRTIGFINNGTGKTSVCAFRIMISIYNGTDWSFETDWEILIVLAFDKPFSSGTSGDVVSDFDPIHHSISVGSGDNKKTYNYKYSALIKPDIENPTSGTINFSDIADSIASLCNTECYESSEIDEITQNISNIYATTQTEPFNLEKNEELIGINSSIYRQIDAAINSGKRNIIFYGPPGTGKTTLAEYLAGEIAEYSGHDRTYSMLTASSSWSSQDLIGGYQPLGHGKIGFIPGVLLRNFDKPIIIDELNRCPIDKVIGPLFSVLSGQTSILPYRVDAEDIDSNFHTIIAKTYDGIKENEHAPSEAWRLICTLNTYDKNQLGQISYALSRRFAWIRIPAPDDTDNFVHQIAVRTGFQIDPTHTDNPIARMWEVTNKYREIGGAPIVDFLKTLFAFDENLEVLVNPNSNNIQLFIDAFSMCILPLMDGLSSRDVKDMATNIYSVWQVKENIPNGEKIAEQFLKMCLEFCG